MKKLSPADVSEFFTRSQFMCPCCKECVIDPRLIRGLEKLRSLAQEEIHIVCAYRCAKQNGEVRGPSRRAHMEGRAADIRIAGLSLLDTYRLANQVPEFHNGGIGINDDRTLHVDVRTFRARWSRLKGTYLSGKE